MAAHTKGPWELLKYSKGFEPPLVWNEDQTVVIFKSGVGDLAYMQHQWGSDIARANARLMVESPAMLEIIKGFLSNIMAPNPHPQDMDFVCTAAQMLIERVTGEKFELDPEDKGQAND